MVCGTSGHDELSGSLRYEIQTVESGDSAISAERIQIRSYRQTYKQFRIVSGLLNRDDVDTIYVCTDSGREGEYIYRLVEQMTGVQNKNRNASGLIPRRKKKFCAASERQRICQNMIICRHRHICVPKKII